MTIKTLTNFFSTDNETKEVAKKNVDHFLKLCSQKLYNVKLKKMKSNKIWNAFKKPYTSCSRTDMSKFLGENLKSDIEISSLFSEAEKIETEITHHSNYVGLVGSAKIGKTNLIKEIVDHHSKNFEFVFYLDLETVDYQNSINLLNLLVPENETWMIDEKKNYCCFRNNGRKL